MIRHKLLILLTGIYILLSLSSLAQLSVLPGQTATTLANTLAGGGVTIQNAVLNCPDEANGKFSYGGVSPVLAINNGILLTNGHAAGAIGAEPPLVNFNNGTPGDPDILPYLPTGATTYDACILEFDVTPTGDTVGFNYQFGSEEYREAVCGKYSDFFAFFISGPGITGTQNMALVPGTNVPVQVNSINNGVVGTVSSADILNCTSLGPGSPFTAYYIDNTGGTQLSYKGYTRKLRAFHSVTPCATYHLKLSIVDVGDADQDSGVFLEENSLSSNGYKFSTIDSIGNTINGIRHTMVKGCSPATVTIVANHADPAPTTVNLVYSGSAVAGTDIGTLPSSVVIPAGSTSVSFTITLLPTFSGTKTLTISIPYLCGYADQLTLTMLDAPSLSILTHDTLVCVNQSFRIHTSGSPGLSYSWSPAADFDTATLAQPVVTPPSSNNIYTLTAAYPNASCPALTRYIKVDADRVPLDIMGKDSIFCTGTYYTFSANSYGLTSLYWSFAPGDTIKNVDTLIYAWSNPGAYTIVAGPMASTCASAASRSIKVYETPGIYLGPDTSICPGDAPFTLHTESKVIPGTQWLWSTGSTSPAITVTNAGTYFATANANGCFAADTIVIANDCYMNIPNAFTPNADGVNDYFFPRQLLTNGLTSFSMEIYDRWGQLIFQSKSVDGRGWDGLYNNIPQPEGVYVYKIDAAFRDGETLHKHGNVTLLR